MASDTPTYDDPVSEFGGGECAASGYSNYRCLREHGTHRLGVVQRYDRLFFVKSLAEPYDSMQLYKMQLEKEFKMLLSVHHPGVVGVYELVEIPGVGLSVLMEYVQGVTLGEWLQRGTLRIERQRVADDLIDAVAALHDAGIVHRDLKPDNIMVTPSGDVRIVDFGLCDAESYALLKQPSGTRGFAAPEQMAEGYVAHPTCDVYALGRMLRMIRPELAYRLAAKKAMQHDPARRPQDAGRLITYIAKMRRRVNLGVAAFLVVAVAAVGVLVLVKYRASEGGMQPQPTVADSGYMASPMAAEIAADVAEAAVSKTEASVVAKASVSPDSGTEKKHLRDEIDGKLSEKASAVVAELRALRADPEMSAEWRMVAAAKLMAELDTYYAEVVNPATEMKDDKGRSLFTPDTFVWENLRAGKLRREAMTLRDSIQSDLERS